MKKYRCASFFAGTGGIDIGFLQTSQCDIVYANEIDKYPIKTYEFNFPIKVDNRSIEKVQPDEIPDFDIMLAGFPCTDISVAGKKKGLFNEDGTLTRSGLFFELIRIAHYKKPKVIFLENVKNLITHNNGETFRIIMEAIKQEGYQCHYKIMNAMDYGNIPQNRERIYIVCFLDQSSFNKFSFPDKIPLTTSIADIIDFKNKLDDKYYYIDGKYKGNIYEKLSESMDDENAVYQWRRWYVRKNKKGVIPTLTANMGGGGHNIPLIKTKFGIRKMTPRECFNAQGYPSSYKLPLDMAESRLYKQAGNAVCITVINRIANNVFISIE